MHKTVHISRSGSISRHSAILLAMCCCCASSVAGQPQPLSLGTGPGVHIRAYDNQPHHDAQHYEHLCRIVLKEFGVQLDTLSLNLVFVDGTIQRRLNALNRDRFHNKQWVGVYIKPMLIIMLGEEESDGTFIHEFMHALNNQGLLFAGESEEDSVHELIRVNEGLLLGSESYLEYLKALPPSSASNR
jgi:hypothetical protein